MANFRRQSTGCAAILGFVFLALSSCGSSAGQQPGISGRTAQVTGTFIGEIRLTLATESDAIGTSVTEVAGFRITQSGGAITGDYESVIPADPANGRASDLSDTGKISGSVVGNQIQATLTHQDGSLCPNWTSLGTLTLLGDRLSGTLTGTCANYRVTEAVTMDRQ